jgi:hypothetical protein
MSQERQARHNKKTNKQLVEKLVEKIIIVSRPIISQLINIEQAKHRKKIDKQLAVKRVKKIVDKIVGTMKEITKLGKSHFENINRGKHRKKVDKQKVERITEKVIIKFGIWFAVVFIPLSIIFFIFFEFGGLLKDAIQFIAGIVHVIIGTFQHIIVTIQKVISAFKQLKR